MILLDTHVWLWWCDDPGRLSPRAREAIESSEQLAVSPISTYELAALAERGRIDLAPDARRWIGDALAAPGTEVLTIDAEIALTAAELPRDTFPGDPADRLIYSTARRHAVSLVTKDRALRAFDPRGTLW